MELKPCPCGSNAIERERHPNIFYRQKYTDRYPEPIASQLHGHRIRCEACGLQTCWWHLPEEADAAWNRRPLEDALSARVAELKAENTRLLRGLERAHAMLIGVHNNCRVGAGCNIADAKQIIAAALEVQP